MAAPNRRISVPPKARKGEIVTVRTLARHPMEPGVRFDADNIVVHPRLILQEVRCLYNGRQVFRAEWFSSVSENPYFTFKLKAAESGTIKVVWVDDYGVETAAEAPIEVTGDGT